LGHLLVLLYNQTEDSTEERIEEVMELKTVNALVSVSPAKNNDNVVTEGVNLSLNTHEEHGE
jgi:serine protease inhibitor